MACLHQKTCHQFKRTFNSLSRPQFVILSNPQHLSQFSVQKGDILQSQPIIKHQIYYNIIYKISNRKGRNHNLVNWGKGITEDKVNHKTIKAKKEK